MLAALAPGWSAPSATSRLWLLVVRFVVVTRGEAAPAFGGETGVFLLLEERALLGGIAMSTRDVFDALRLRVVCD